MVDSRVGLGGVENLATIGFRSPDRSALSVVAKTNSLSQPTSVVPKNEKSQRTPFKNVCTALQHTASHVLVRNCIVELFALSVFSVTLGSYIALIVTHSTAWTVSYNIAPP